MNATLTRKSGHGSPPLRFFDGQNADGSNSSGPGISRDRLGSGATGRRPVVGLRDQADRVSALGWSSPSRATLIKKRSPS